MNRVSGLLACMIAFTAFSSVSAYQLLDHPRIFVNRQRLGELAARSQGVLAREYALIKAEADRAMSEGVQRSSSRFRTPIDQLCLGITYLIERELGRDAEPYAETVKAFWADGQELSLAGSGHFGYHAMVYDWIYDSLNPDERQRFGNALAPWLRWYTDTPEITLKNGYWWYNQTWGPAHLNTPNTRDGIAPKLLLAIAIAAQGPITTQMPHAFSTPGHDEFRRNASRPLTRWGECGQRAWDMGTMVRWP